jgi:hypothetical protein
MRLFRFIPNRHRAAMRWNELLGGFALLRRQLCTSLSQYPSNMNNLATSPIPSPWHLFPNYVNAPRFIPVQSGEQIVDEICESRKAGRTVVFYAHIKLLSWKLLVEDK